MTDEREDESRNRDEEPIESVGGLPRRSVLRAAGVFAGTGIAGTGLTATQTAAETLSNSKGGAESTTDTDSPLPGPEVLYESPASAPQLENANGWEAEPLMVSGADAYVDGEFLYQDFVYDDYGANTTALPLPPTPEPNGEVQSELLPSALNEPIPELTPIEEYIGMAYGAATGDVVYPTDDSTYRNNAADLLEFRARTVNAGEQKVTYRITLNTMTEAGVAAAAIGIDKSGFEESDESGDNALPLDDLTDTLDENTTIDEALGIGGSSGTDWGYGIGELGVDLDHVLVTWGDGAELDGSSEGVDVAVSERRNQIDVTVPLAPAGETWRHYLVVGLFDEDEKEFTAIQNSPGETHPGGAQLGSPPPVFNVGFRSSEQEPMGAPNIEPEDLSQELEQTLSGIGARGGPLFGYGHWREHAQAKALAARDISPFHADIDFGKLDAGTTDYNVPETGYISRLYASRYDFTSSDVEFEPGEGIDDESNVITGRIQPYAIYVPERYDSTEPTPFLLNLHSLFSTYNEFAVLMPDQLKQLGEQRDSIVMIPEGRGGEGWWRGEAELDAFEAWSDAAARYNLDFDRTCITGYSMGGYGTEKLASQYPDLFAKGFPIVGPQDEKAFAGTLGEDFGTIYNVSRIIENLRHVPLLMWNGANDELVPISGVLRYEQKLRDLGYRHELDVFPGYDHFVFGLMDEWGPGRDFLGNATVERSPPQITYRAIPATNHEELGLVHDGAYWVSDITVVDGADSGLIDVRSAAIDGAPPIVVDYRGPGTKPAPHVKRGTRWNESMHELALRNALDIDLEEVSAVTIWVEDAQLSTNKPIELDIDSTTPATITLASSDGTTDVHIPDGHSEKSIQI
jgi:dienelactone hydrolase